MLSDSSIHNISMETNLHLGEKKYIFDILIFVFFFLNISPMEHWTLSSMEFPYFQLLQIF